MAPLFQLLKGDTDINAPRRWTEEAHKALQMVNEKISAQQCHRRSENFPLQSYICNQEQQRVAIIGQWDPFHKDPLVVLEWVFLPHQPLKTIAT